MPRRRSRTGSGAGAGRPFPLPWLILLAAVALGARPGAAGTGGDAAVHHRPYLQLAGPRCVPTVIWSSAAAERGRVVYRLDGGPERIVADAAPCTHHAVPLNDLPPGGEVLYRVEGPDAVSAPAAFTTLPSRREDGTSAPFLWIAYGDNRSHPELHAQVISSILRGPPPALVVSTGDLVYSGSDGPSWNTQFLDPAERLFRRAPVMLSLGNHDLDTRAPRPHPLAPWWLEHFAFPGEPGEAGYGRWFSFEAGGIHFLHLDSTAGADSVQLAWLAADLASPAARQADFRVAVFHHPPYTAGGHDPQLELRELWEPLLVGGRVDLVLNGHNHFYQRSWPVAGGRVVARAESSTAAGDVILGGSAPVYVVTGGGGAPLYDPEPAPFVAAAAKRLHHLRLEYRPGELQATALAEDDSVLDRFLLRHRR